MSSPLYPWKLVVVPAEAAAVGAAEVATVMAAVEAADVMAVVAVVAAAVGAAE